MRIVMVHNAYGRFSGEEAVVHSLCQLLSESGHEVIEFFRQSGEIPMMHFGKTRAFVKGIYSFSSRKAMKRCLDEFKPDIVHIHNLFPLISPSVLGECRKAGVPVVMTVHNYRLVCPNGLHLPKGRHEICEKCCGGHEYWCILRNCEQSFFKSLGYALRTYTARRLGLFVNNVSIFACLTDFQRKRLVPEGYPADRLCVIPNMYPADMETGRNRNGTGDYVAYVGRIGPEKGIQLLLSAARIMPNILFRLAGNYDAMTEAVDSAPANVSFLGNVAREQLPQFYRQSRFLVVCSTSFEGFPMAIVEAMVHGKPVIAPRIGGIPEIVDDSKTGLLFSVGNAGELADKIRHLSERPDLCWQMGRAGREKALREYSPARYYERLIEVYQRAMSFVGRYE